MDRSLCNFLSVNAIVFYRDKNLRFTGQDSAVCSRKSLAGQVAIPAGHYPLLTIILSRVIKAIYPATVSSLLASETL